MSNKTAFTRCGVPSKIKKAYKKQIHKLNRRKARQNPEHIDKKPDSREID